MQHCQASGDIVLVAIDSPSIEKLGVWRWPRQYHADLIGKLASAGETLRRIQALGVHISFDDFGTGYARLTYRCQLREFADRFLTKSVRHSEPPQWRKRATAA